MSAGVHASYIGDGPDAALGLLHEPRPQQSPKSSVLLVGPWGWNDIASYRRRRAFAETLAAAGHPTLRIELPGTGDSGGAPADPDRLGAWTRAVLAAAQLLRARPDVSRSAVVAMGLGGLPVSRAVDSGAPIDDAVLWAVGSKGRAALRAETAFAALQRSSYTIGSEPPADVMPQGWIESGGFVLSPETAEALKAIDLTALSTGRLRRALLLDGDGRPVDERLRSHLADNGVEVTVDAGPGWAALVGHPESSDVPTDDFRRMLSFLDGVDEPTPEPDGVAVTARPEMQLAGGTHERPISFPSHAGEMFGVLSEPADQTAGPVTTLFLNAGAVRRIGPNRLWCEAARRWAVRGVRSVRVDLEAIGDADGDDSRYTDVGAFYDDAMTAHVIAIMDDLERRGLGARFLLVGLCSGGFWAFQAATRDPRVQSVVMLNPGALAWDEGLSQRTEAGKLARLLQPVWWRKILRGEIGIERMRAIAGAALRSLRSRLRARASGVVEGSLASQVRAAADRGTRIVIAFSGREPLESELRRTGVLELFDALPTLERVRLPADDHTLRPMIAQRAAHELLDAELVRVAAAGSSGS